MVVVKETVRGIAGDLRVSRHFLDELDARVVQLIEDARQRAMANGRRTLMPQDL